MTAGNDNDPNNIVSSLPLMEETTRSKKQQLAISIGTLTSPPPTLPFELIEEILCSLPVRFLIQLQCVCKSWNSLISDPKFTTKHFRLSSKRHHLIVSSKNNLKEPIFLDSPISSVFSTSRAPKPTQLSYPITRTNDTYSGPSYLTSCDGILCFTISNTSAVLWNPSIRKLKILPPFENPQQRYSRSDYSFGYDHFIDNYKIIRVSFCNNQDEVSVFTLGDDNWRSIPHFPYGGHISGPGTFVSGTVNWVTYDPPGTYLPTLVSLDLEKESYQKLPQPDLGVGFCGFCRLGVLKDCLSIFASYKKFLDVWIMKEYGNKESWTKLYTIHYKIGRGLRAYTNAFYVSEDDRMLIDFFDWRSSKLKLVVYDSKNNTLNITRNQIINRQKYPEVYVESLISPCS